MNSGLFTVGLIVLILGILAFAYTAVAPYGAEASLIDSYDIALIVLGIIVMIIGALIPSVTSTSTSSSGTQSDSYPHSNQKKTKTTTMSED